MNVSSVKDEETVSLLLFQGKTLIKMTLANIECVFFVSRKPSVLYDEFNPDCYQPYILVSKRVLQSSCTTRDTPQQTNRINNCYNLITNFVIFRER